MPKGGFRLPKPNHPNTRSKNMSIANYPITQPQLFLATAAEIAQCEAALNTQFEADYRE